MHEYGLSPLTLSFLRADLSFVWRERKRERERERERIIIGQVSIYQCYTGLMSHYYHLVAPKGKISY